MSAGSMVAGMYDHDQGLKREVDEKKDGSLERVC